MKVIHYLILIFACTFVACTSSEDKLKQEYIEACADGDFVKARAAVQKLEAIDHSLAVTGTKYVNDKEIYALVAKPSRDNDSRILFLYNSSESWELPDMSDVVQVAISMNNENLPMKLLKSGVGITTEIVKTAITADQEQLVTYIIQNQPTYLSDQMTLNYYKNVVGEEELVHLISDNATEFNNETLLNLGLDLKNEDLISKALASQPDLLRKPHVQDYIKSGENAGLIEFILRNASQFNAEALLNLGIDIDNVDMVAKALSLDPTLIENNQLVEYSETHNQIFNIIKQTQINKLKEELAIIRQNSFPILPKGLTEEEVSATEQNEKISQYNNQLSSLLDKAIDAKQWGLCDQIISTMKPNIEVYQGNSSSPVYHGIRVGYFQYLVWYNHNDINMAKQKLNHAKR